MKIFFLLLFGCALYGCSHKAPILRYNAFESCTLKERDDSEKWDSCDLSVIFFDGTKDGLRRFGRMTIDDKKFDIGNYDPGADLHAFDGSDSCAIHLGALDSPIGKEVMLLKIIYPSYTLQYKLSDPIWRHQKD